MLKLKLLIQHSRSITTEKVTTFNIAIAEVLSSSVVVHKNHQNLLLLLIKGYGKIKNNT